MIRDGFVHTGFVHTAPGHGADDYNIWVASEAYIKGKDIAIFTRQLSTMLRSGVPLLQAFDIVARGSPNPRLTRMLKLYVATHEELTQKRVAQEAGISESSLSRFLSGEQMLDGRAFAALVAWCFGDHKA